MSILPSCWISLPAGWWNIRFPSESTRPCAWRPSGWPLPSASPRQESFITPIGGFSRHRAIMWRSSINMAFASVWPTSEIPTPMQRLRVRTLNEIQNRLPHFLEEVYNHKRLHSSIGYVPPVEFEELFYQTKSCPVTLIASIYPEGCTPHCFQCFQKMGGLFHLIPRRETGKETQNISQIERENGLIRIENSGVHGETFLG
jgi:hypothetical protein